MFLQATEVALKEDSIGKITTLLTHPTMWAVGILLVVLYAGYKVWYKTSTDQNAKDLKQIEVDGKVQEKVAETLRAIQDEMKIYFDSFQKVIEKNADSRDANSKAIIEQAASIGKLAEACSGVRDEVRVMENVLRSKPCGKDLPNV